VKYDLDSIHTRIEVKKTKKHAITCIILCAFVLFAALNMPAARASINNYNWISTAARNEHDDFYGSLITAYEENTSAILVVSVSNDIHDGQLNVSAVKVGFDWGVNYSSSECSIENPFGITSSQSHVFTINFTVPSALFASNLVTHSYTIYVESVNSTSGNKGLTNSWILNGNGFAVFSTDQAAAQQYKQEVDAYPTTNFNGIPFLTANARQLLQQSNVAKTLASDSYMRGDFSAAAAHYKSSLDSIQHAWSNETAKWSTFEDAIAGILQGGGNMLTMQGYAWLIFAVGFLIISIGVLTYLVRRRTPPPPKVL
jgi:hypothetical protein